LSGFAQSGKDTVASILVSEHGYKRIAFADPIKDLLLKINPQSGMSRVHPLVDKLGWDIAKQIPEVRKLLQDLGTGAREVLGQDVWVKAALSKAHDNIGGLKGKYVFTDVRFTNEAKFIKEMGGVIWRIDRPNVVAANAHVSEHELNEYEFDQWIHNSEDLNFLKEAVEKVLRHAE
jgi:hypothetical protein